MFLVYVLQLCLPSAYATAETAKPYQLYFLKQYGYRNTKLQTPNSNVMQDILAGRLFMNPNEEEPDELNQSELSNQIKEMQLYADIPQTGIGTCLALKNSKIP